MPYDPANPGDYYTDAQWEALQEGRQAIADLVSTNTYNSIPSPTPQAAAADLVKAQTAQQRIDLAQQKLDAANTQAAIASTRGAPPVPPAALPTPPISPAPIAKPPVNLSMFNTRFYLIRPSGKVDTGYQDGTHQIQFANIADFMYFTAQHGEMIFQLFSDAEAQAVLAGIIPAGRSPQPSTGTAPAVDWMGYLPWIVGGYIAYKILF